MKHIKGFTLIELMIAVAVVAIIAAIAIPSYREYIKKKDLALAQQEVSRIATELDRHKLKNFSFKGYCPGDCTSNSFTIPLGSSEPIYTITVVDGDTKGDLAQDDAKGLTWAINAVRYDMKAQAKNYDLLFKSDGVRCMTKTTGSVASFNDCGSDSENW